jgi:Uma2 family endonuclease
MEKTMTTLLDVAHSQQEIIYPSSDGEPLAETYDHLIAITTTLLILLKHLEGQQATVLADQFLYYAQGFPRLRVAPDVMVILGVAPGGRDNYKTWVEGQVPAVIFDISTPLNIKMTSPGTRSQDEVEKKKLYESIGVTEYWQFDPRGEWIVEKLRGYRLVGDLERVYMPIVDNRSNVLQLQFSVDQKIIAFHRLDNGVKLLTNDELNIALEQTEQRFEAEMVARQQAEQRAEAESQRADLAAQRAEILADRLRQLGLDPEKI